jgi:hypothetical protein
MKYQFTPFLAGRRHAQSASLVITLLMMLAAWASPAYSQRSRGSIRSVNRTGNGGTWSGPRGSGSTNRTVSGDTSSRTTSVQGRNGQSATGTRNVTKDGDTVNVDRNVQSSTGASKTSSKEYKVDDGRVESVERDTQVTNRYGQTAEYEGKAERDGYGVKFEGEGKNRYGQDVDVEGYGGRGYYGKGVVADVDGGRYGDRTVVAGRAYGGPAYVRNLPAGYKPYTYYGRPYYGYGGYYYRPIGGFYYPVPPPYGYCCYSSSQMAGAIAITVAGVSMMYAAGSYYEKSKSQSGQEQYKVVSPPAGATLPKTAVPADAATVTFGGTTYYYYANTFYKVAPVNGQMGFVVVEQPTGVQTVKALPADVQPQQVGSTTYLVSGGRYYLVRTDAAGQESYIVVDAPKAA